MPRLRVNNEERNQAIGLLNAGMSATVVSRHLVVLERLSSVYGDDSVSQKTFPTILEVVGRGREVERRPCNHEVPSSSPGSGSQLWDFSLAHTFGASTGVVPRKQNRERLV